jgi:hypothetical protein
MNEKNEKVSSKSSIKIGDLVSIFVQRKWFFVIFFVAVLVVGMLFAFIKTPQYETYTYLKLKSVYYDENLYKYFPDKAGELGIFAPGMDVKELEGSALRDIIVSIRDAELLEHVSGKLEFEISGEELGQIISTLTDSGNKIVKVTTIYDNADKAYQINNALINAYLENNKNKKSEIVNGVLLEASNKIEVLQGEHGENNNGSESSGNAVHDLDSPEGIIDDLNKIKYNLESNRETYIDNIEIQKEPFIPTEAINMDILKSILVAVFAALAAGLIAVYLPGVFSSFRE